MEKNTEPVIVIEENVNAKIRDSLEKNKISIMNINDIELDVRLLRFLMFGDKNPIYICKANEQKTKIYPKPTRFAAKHTTFINEILSSESSKLVVPAILKIYEDGISTEPHALLYVLACAVNAKNSFIKHTAYSSIDNLIITGVDFLIFNFYLKSLNAKRTGYGSGWRKAVRRWYNSKNAIKLAELILPTPKLGNCHHKTIMDLAHVKFGKNDGGKHVVYHYVKFGLNYVVRKYGNNPDLHPLVRFIKRMHSLQNTIWSCVATKYTRNYLPDISFFPRNFINLPEVWFEFIVQMPTETLITIMNYLAKLGILYHGSVEHLISCKLEIICDRQLNITTDPSVIYIALMNYKHTLEVFQKKQKHKKNKSLIIINDNICNNMMKLTMKALQNLETTTITPTGLKYLIVIDHRYKMLRNGYGEKLIYRREAAFMIVLYILYSRPFSDVALVTEHNKCIKQFDIEYKKETWKSLDRKLRTVSPQFYKNRRKTARRTSLNVLNVIQWASEPNNQWHDIIIVLGLSDMFYRDVKKHLEQFRENVNNKTRLVLCFLDGPPSNDLTDLIDDNIFIICGFNEKVCRLIDSFSNGVF